MQLAPPHGPPARRRRHLGRDDAAGVAALAVLLAIYAATTVRDPMAKRVKALNDRREQLKAGIIASTTKRRASSPTATRRPTASGSLLSQLKVLQDSQVKKAQQQADAGRHPQEGMAVAVIFARLVLPIVLGVDRRGRSSMRIE